MSQIAVVARKNRLRRQWLTTGEARGDVRMTCGRCCCPRRRFSVARDGTTPRVAERSFGRKAHVVAPCDLCVSCVLVSVCARLHSRKKYVCAVVFPLLGKKVHCIVPCFLAAVLRRNIVHPAWGGACVYTCCARSAGARHAPGPAPWPAPADEIA